MKSIRRTLLASLVALVAIALTGVAAVLDRIAAANLEVSAQAEARVIEHDYQVGVRGEQDKFDQQLLDESRTLASQMQSMYATRFDREVRRFRTAYTISEHLAVNPWAQLGFYEASVHSRLAIYFSSSRSYFTNLHLDDSFGQGDSEDSSHDPHPRFFQINIASRTDSVWKSKSLNSDSFPHDPSLFDQQKLEDSRKDTLTLRGQKIRRVGFRSPIILPWWRPGSSPRQNAGGPRDRRQDGERDRPTPPSAGPPMPPTGGPTTPAQFLAGFPQIYVYCARPYDAINSQLESHRQTRDEQLQALAKSVQAARFRLRATVLAVGTIALVMILLGGLWLVRRGLMPLDRLSDAVGNVSEKDFRLPIEKTQLSTELLPIHVRLTETLDQLKRAFEREKQAVADISHELRTPVAALLATIDVSLRKPRPAEQYRQTLEECRIITRQLGQLVERVMTLAYLDAGHAKVSLVRVPAVELAQGCASVIRPLAEARGLKLALKADPIAELDTDREKLREVLMNLLHNAVEYNNPGGTIELVVHGDGNGRVVFDVRDTGIGMTDEVAGKVFERFYRADPSRTETGVHAGLGLAIVKEYVERLGGTITVESAPGKGSLFRVELPAAEVEAEPPSLAT